MDTFYENFIALCARKGKSPGAVAEAIGLSRASAAGWKKGKLPRDTTVVKIAQYFNVPVSALIEGADIPPKEKSPVPMSEGEAYWAERLNALTPPDQALVSSVVDRLQSNPEASRAALGLFLTAVQSAPRV